MIPAKQLKIGNYVLHNSEPSIVRELKLTDAEATVVLQGLFSDKTTKLATLPDEPFQEAEVMRRCANIISKSKEKVELMDSTSFETFNAVIEPFLLSQLGEGDPVTYIRNNDSARVVELRKDRKDAITSSINILQEDL